MLRSLETLGDCRHILLLTNPGAGSVDESAISAASAVWRSAGVTITRLDLDESTSVWRKEALSPVYDRVVLAGGDGTVHRVVSALADAHQLSALTFGILPLGTGNDLARGLGLPGDPNLAARVVLHGARRPLDLLRDDRGGVVVNAAHVGLGALASERAQGMKEVLGPLGYAAAALVAGASMKDYVISVRVDGRALTENDERLLMVGLGVGNSIGGGARLAPEASPDDGLVDVVLVSATGPISRAAFARSLQQGSHVAREDVRVVRGRHVRVDAEDCPLNVDGEVLGDAGTIEWTVVPGGWAVAVERASDDTGADNVATSSSAA